MKAALILVAIACLLVLALAMSRAVGAGGTSFSSEDRRTLIVDYPGGEFVNDWTYRRCEDGETVERSSDGRLLRFDRECWR